MDVTCFLCGAPISETIKGWVSEFRALYRESDVLGFPQLSGVGDLTVDHVVPANFGAHRQDAALKPSNLRKTFSHIKRGPMKIFTAPPELEDLETVWGWPGHVACWTLLSLVFAPEEIFVDWLDRLCASSPSRKRGRLDLGLNYGDIFKFGTTFLANITLGDNDLPFLPGEEREINDNLTWPEVHGSSNTTIYYADPLQAPNFVQLPSKSVTVATDHNLEDHNGHSSLEKAQVQQEDCFSDLPSEVLELIMSRLPSKDVVTLKVASSNFTYAGLGAHFWASRFHRGFEFDRLLNSSGHLPKNVDWKASYMQAKTIQPTPNFRNRKRIWNILLQLKDVLSAMSRSAMHGLVQSAHAEPNYQPFLWKRSLVKPTYHPTAWNTGDSTIYCSTFHRREVNIPSRLTRVFATLIKLNNTEYISGLRFVSNTGSESKIGFIDREREIFLQLRNSVGQEVSGIKLAIHPKGICAIGILMVDKRASDMIGDSKFQQMIMKATTSEETINMSCDFDELKLVSLAIPYHPKEELQDFRDNFLWFPRTPSNDLHLSKPYSLNEPREYRVLTTCIFGGVEGNLLQNLMQIAVSEFYGRIWGIEFRYNAEVHGQRSQTLGRKWPFVDGALQDFAHERLFEYCERRVFSFDGPGGEIIAGIDLITTHLSIEYLQIHTNFGRSMSFPHYPDVDDWGQLTSISIPESHTVIGIYAELKHVSVITELGVISKKL